MPKTYRVAVIGRTGKGNYGHGLDEVWKLIDNAEIVAVADEDEKGRAAAVKRLNCKTGYADWREMLEKEKPNIVSVCSRWLDGHREMVVGCAEAGASIFLEKPVARNLAEADEMVTACERHHVKLAVAHQTRYSPRLKRVKELIGDKLGDLVEMRGRGKEELTRGGGQDMMVLGSHIMDLMRYLAGDAQWCFAKLSQNGRPVTKDDVREGVDAMGPAAGDDIQAMYGFAGGVTGTFATRKSKHGAGKRFGLQVFGTKGVVHLEFGGLPAVWFLDDPSWFPGKSKMEWQEVTSAGIGKPEPLKDGGYLQSNSWIAKDLLESIEKDRQPLGSLYDGRAALEMILATYESHRLKGPAELPLKNRRHPLELL